MHSSTYDHVRCPVCGVPWKDHGDDCPRHPYRPTVRVDSNGREVTDWPQLWSEEDRFYTAEEARCRQPQQPQ